MITFHRANNLGANLQAFALNKYINNNIGECEIIDFIPNDQVDKRPLPIKLLSFAKRVTFATLNKREKRFNKFKKANYKLSSKTFKGDNEMLSATLKYDVLISGSDQILNTTLSGNSNSFYLAFDKKAKKISYASSFGRNEITQEEKQNIAAFLPEFSDLSAREQSGVDIIKQYANKDATLVLDPVFLMSGNEWQKIKTTTQTPQKYIFVYAMEPTEQLKKAIKHAKNRLGLEVLVVYGGGSRGIEGTEIFDCGPGEFLSYIDGAELVITNSFHGTAFSVLFEKDFVCVAHSSRNARLENILSLTQNEGKLVLANEDYDFDQKLISGKSSLEQLTPYIEISKEYLNKNCKI